MVNSELTLLDQDVCKSITRSRLYIKGKGIALRRWRSLSSENQVCYFLTFVAIPV
jgi:hypothetical protein